VLVARQPPRNRALEKVSATPSIAAGVKLGEACCNVNPSLELRMMYRTLGLAVALLLFASHLSAAEFSAKIQRIDAERGLAVVVAGGQERSLRVGPEVKLLDAQGNVLAEGLRSPLLAVGVSVTLSADRQAGGPLLKSIRISGGQPAATPQADAKPIVGDKPAKPPGQDTSQLTPLTDLGRGANYHGFPGGQYRDASNQRPAEHEQAGLKIAASVRPLDKQGQPSADGKIVVLGIGFSNTLQCMNGLLEVAAGDRQIDPHVVLVNGAQGGRSAFMIQNPRDGSIGQEYWDQWVPGRLASADVTAAQVQAIWLKETDASLNPGMLKKMGVEQYENPLAQGFPKGAQTLQAELKRIVLAMPGMFPNLKLVYLSSRSYGGWTIRGGNSEPWSYETGFAVKWLIEEQIAGTADMNFDATRGPLRAPWLSWGPYLWANGNLKRGDGFSFDYDDYRENDRMHHSPQGMTKMGHVLLNFFKTDATTRSWFVAAKPKSDTP
jgi:hypothetical protein